jgi:ketosteroid isomerase-like protein
MNMKYIIAGFVSIMSLTAFSQSSGDQDVWRNVEALNGAVFSTKDSNALNALLSDKASYSHSNGAIESKAEMVVNAVANKTTYRDIGMEKISLTVVDNTAIARHLFTATQTDKEGKESALRLGVLQVWMKTGNQWELLARQAVRVATK